MATSTRFNCALSEEMRLRLRERREKLGLSLKQLGELLHISWSTVRNWENARTRTCHPANLRRITSFLDGEYDAMVFAGDESSEYYAGRWGQSMSPMVAYCAERISDTCRLCAENEEIRNQLVKDINASVAKALRLMLE